ncbi:MAG TPA: HDOD domain-containing protein [Caulifigura sp.]|nr:HDOD domain-containing protein [Caulifigura sp.]
MSVLVAEPPADLSVPPERLVRRLLGQNEGLTMLPAVAMQALQLANNPDCSVNQFAALVQQDQKLASDILAIANTALYSGGKPIANLQQAAQRLGFRKCKNLILTSSMSSLMKQLSFDEQWMRDILWRHSFLAAIHCHHLNKLFAAGFDGEEFTAGLMHDLGRTLLAVAAGSAEFSAADPLSFEEDEGLIERERELLGTDHTQFGAWFVRRSNLPEALIETVLQHHHCEESSKLTAIVAAADDMTNHLQRYLEPDQYSPENNRGLIRLEALGIRDARKRLDAQRVTLMEEAAEELAELVKRMG